MGLQPLGAYSSAEVSFVESIIFMLLMQAFRWETSRALANAKMAMATSDEIIITTMNPAICFFAAVIDYHPHLLQNLLLNGFSVFAGRIGRGGDCRPELPDATTASSAIG
ncbi:MAG: hypothetical protein WC789_12310 [Lentisphaeria bacterium]|jgi:hypothetical protein